nr:retrotransposon protein, putative, Ty1-copia subclass [Tanacetum cinerariifolium]
MKDLGEAAYILGIKIYRDRSRRLISLCQSAYIEKILKRYCMENSKRGSIPMQEKLKLSKSQGASTSAELKCMQNVPYASVVGSIMYAMRCTRPDVANKRAKLDLDSALLWHCRLGHISKKRIEKLQHDGLFDSSDLRAFVKCVSCMSEKMARKPYTHQVERTKDLLGLIHTDVCGPFKIMSRQRASYFVTFTDDFSRYGYVYLLKHKHEVFETFKVFQKEVENQLGKTIKSLRSDRGGEYMSQEFLDHL